jgi:hydrogenase/urease accessory protein HupE
MYTKAVSLLAIMSLSLPAIAHSEHSSALNGIIHFMTEPDHLALLGLVAAVVVFAVRKMINNRV